jgi:Peptidase M50B-like
MSVLWERLAGTQPVPPVWVVAVAGLAALAVVLDVRAWHLTRNAITIAHEGGHALISVLSGRRLEGIRLHSDTSGETVSRGKRSGPGMVLTAFAGYVTPPLLGAGAAVLLFTHHVTLLLWAFLALLLAAFVMMRNAFGIVVALVVGGAVFGVTAYASSLVQALFSYGVAWFLLFGGLRPVLELPRRAIKGAAGLSDADHLFRLTRIPTSLWVGLFHVVSLAAVVVGGRLLVPLHGYLPHVSLHP